MNITGREPLLSKSCCYITLLSLTSPTRWIFVTKFQRTLKKDTSLWYILHSHLFGYGSLLIGSILPRIYYIFIFYKFTKFWDLYLHFLYVIPTYRVSREECARLWENVP